jgi:hypothetical protein
LLLLFLPSMIFEKLMVMSLPSSSSFSSAAEDEDDVRDEYCDDYAVNENKNKNTATTTRTMVVPPP